MPMNASFAHQLRLNRLSGQAEGRLLVVPLDHTISDGPVTGGRRVDRLLGQLAAGGADAVVVHKGVLRYVNPMWFQQMSLIIHLSASTRHADDPDFKYLVTDVEEALRLGADAVSVHVNIGSRQEARQIGDLGRVAAACERWNVPLLAMVYPRGPQILDSTDPDLVAHGAIVAADLGADMVKLPWVGSAAAMTDVVSTCPIPVVVAGGSPRDCPASLMAYVDEVLASGAAGLAVGRNIFQSQDPQATVCQISSRVHALPQVHMPHPFGAVKEIDLDRPAGISIVS